MARGEVATMGDIALAVLVHLVIGAVLLWTGVRGWQGTLSMRGPGIRTARTLASEEAWHATHRASGPWLAGAGAIAVVVGVLLPVFAEGEHEPLLTGVGTAAVIALTVVGARNGLRALTDG